MGSSTCVRLFYGNFHFTESTWAEFLAAIDKDEINEHDAECCDISVDHARDNDIQHTIAVCQKLGISYDCHFFDDMEFSYIEWWRPGMTESRIAPRHVDGSATVRLSELSRAIKEGRAEQLLELLPPDLSGATFSDDCAK